MTVRWRSPVVWGEQTCPVCGRNRVLEKRLMCAIRWNLVPADIRQDRVRMTPACAPSRGVFCSAHAARRGKGWQGPARRGEVGRGEARHGGAGRGKAWKGAARVAPENQVFAPGRRANFPGAMR